MIAKQVKGMAKGQYGDSIQALPVDDTIHAKVTIGASSVVSDLTGAQIVRIASDVDIYVKFGTSGVTVTVANGIYFPAGVEVFIMPINDTHVAVIQNATAGIATITKVGE